MPVLYYLSDDMRINIKEDIMNHILGGVGKAVYQSEKDGCDDHEVG